MKTRKEVLKRLGEFNERLKELKEEFNIKEIKTIDEEGCLVDIRMGDIRFTVVQSETDYLDLNNIDKSIYHEKTISYDEAKELYGDIDEAMDRLTTRKRILGYQSFCECFNLEKRWETGSVDWR